MGVLSDFEACVILNSLSGIGPSRFNALVRTFGRPGEIFSANVKTIASVGQIGFELAQKVVNYKDHVNLAEELFLAERAGAEIYTRYDERYPEVLLSLPDAPILLYVRGKIPQNLASHALAVVGTRHMTRYGREVAQHLTEAAVLSNWVIVSGLASGIDTVAHESTIRLGGITIGVLGGGLGRIYPQESVPIVRQIIETNGAVISEFPMMMPPNRRTFPMRNRIVAGLSRGVLVVEASATSGACITANLGLEYGRTIFAVPGQVDNPQSKGCHKLLKQGAKLVETFNDIAEEFDFLPGFAEGSLGSKINEGKDFIDNDLTTDERLVLNALTHQNLQDFDELVSSTSMSTGPLLSTLFGLELKRKIKTSSNGKYTLNR